MRKRPVVIQASIATRTCSIVREYDLIETVRVIGTTRKYEASVDRMRGEWRGTSHVGFASALDLLR